MKPIQNMLCFRAHRALKLAHRVAAIREKRDLLVHLHPLGREDLMQPPFRFGVERLHKAKALARGGLVFLIAFESERTFPDNDLKVMLLGFPVPHVASVNAHRDRPIWDGQGTNPGTPSIKLHCSSPSSASQRSATFRASYRTVLTSRVTSSGRKSGERLDGQP